MQQKEYNYEPPVDLSKKYEDLAPAKIVPVATQMHRVPTMVAFIMRFSGGLIRNEQQALLVLIGCIVACSAFTLSILITAYKKDMAPERPFDGGSNPAADMPL